MSKLADSKFLSEELSLESCPLDHEYYPDLHDAIANSRIVDGSWPEHAKHGSDVNFFAPAGAPKYWAKASTPAFEFFFYYTLDMSICPHLASMFGMQIWHPTTEAAVDELLGA